DDPFGIADSTSRKTRPLVATAPDLPDLPGAPPLAGFGDESTLIRPPPGRGMAAPLPLQASDWGEAETVIKPMPPGAAEAHPAAGGFGQDTTVLRPDPVHDTVVRPTPPTGRPAGIGVHVLYLSLVLLCSAASLFTGVLLAQWRLGADAAVTAAVVPQHPPQLRVVLPPEATLSVNGRPVPGPSPIDVPLTAGDDHQVEVTLAGHAPWSARLKLEPNEIRVLTFQAGRLEAGGR
ncbi:hypothetical protein L6R53_31430, partial [Myxococcota bacterium]|nr:hypothetical protein [Myxococcota bacterium]